MEQVVTTSKKGISKPGPVKQRIVMLDSVKNSGSSGLAVGVNQDLQHQEDLEEFSPFFGQVSHEVLVAHGFVTH